jgi:hypothetical protein
MFVPFLAQELQYKLCCKHNAVNLDAIITDNA